MGSKFIYGVHESPIIAAIKTEDQLHKVIKSESKIIFILNGNVFNLKEVVSTLKKHGKVVFIHVDLVDGISNDIYGLEYIVDKVKPDGIISTKGKLIVAAKKLNLFTIQRLFILDSLSLSRSKKSVKSYKPDAIEILPGIMNKITKQLSKELNIPIIAGGLIKDKEDVIEALRAGAIGVSSTSEKVWNL